MKRNRSALIAVLFVVIMVIAVVPMLTVQGDYGTNWQGTFFTTTNLGGTSVGPITIPNGLNFTFPDNSKPNFNGVDVPIANCTPTNPPITDTGTSPNCDNFWSARFTSSQNITPGVYNFVISSDDGVRVIVNGQTIVDNFIGRALTTDSRTVTISTSPANITVEYFEGTGQAVLQVQWFLVSSSGATAIPGQTLVYGTPAPITTAVPPFTISVSGVKAEALRTGPYLGASLIGEVAAGTPITPLARNKDEGIYNWYLVNTGTKTGWISGRYVTITGDLNSIPLQSSIFEQIDGAPDVGVLAVPRSVMNLRRRPSIRSAKILEVAWGAETALIGRTIQGGRNFWLQVRLKTGEVGWIFAPFVSIRGDVNSVPIR